MSRRGKAEAPDAADAGRVGAGLCLKFFGPFTIERDGQGVPLPASRKLRALLAYLALAARPLGRSQLCELFWEGPSDPRAELRWCLSRLRSVIDEPDRLRVRTDGDTVAVDLSGCVVDAVEVLRAMGGGVSVLTPARQRELIERFGGEFLEGLDLADSPGFGQWLVAQRRRFQECHSALLEQLVSSETASTAQAYLEQWLQLSPFDRRVHERLFEFLSNTGRLAEGDAHAAATAVRFDAEGLDPQPIYELWRRQRQRTPEVAVSACDVGVNQDPASEAVTEQAARRASIVVMPFESLSGVPTVRGGAADALAHDITALLAKLRSLFVISQGSAFALHERRIGPEEAGRMLDVDYVVCGTVGSAAGRTCVTVELIETRTARMVWSEMLSQPVDDTLQMIETIANRIVASIANEIEMLERNRAILRPPNSLDAWEAHHRGLWHMYRFTKDDNAQARHFFKAALSLDPTFSRAYAGLSFTHFQNAFQKWAPRASEVEAAFAAAGQSLMADDRDPAAHWAMGRALWLQGNAEQSVPELERAIELSPNFAQGHYALAFVQSQSGDPHAAIAMADCSRELSPFDPMLFGMLGARAIALTRLGRYEEAAVWAKKAAARPNAHPHIHIIAACTQALAGEVDEASARAAAVSRLMPAYQLSDFFEAFKFDSAGEALFRTGAIRVGIK